ASVASGRAYSRLARIVSWNMCASWVTTPMAACSESWVTDRTSCPPTSTAPPLTSYRRAASAVIVVLPAPDGPTSAVICPDLTVNDTPFSTVWDGVASRTATDSRDASETSSALGYPKTTSSNCTTSAPGARSTAFGASATIGGRSSTSNTRSNDTSAVMTSTCTFDSEVRGPYSWRSSAANATSVPTSIVPLMARTPPRPYTMAVAS